MMDRRGRLLMAALGFAGRSMPSYDRALWALRSWLDSWPGVGHVAVGIHRQGFDLQLTQYDERGWRATFYTTGMEHSPTSATGTAWERTPWHARAESAFVSCYTPRAPRHHALRISEEAIMRKALLLIGVALAGAAAGAVGATYVSAQNPAQVTRTELLRKPITGIEGKEVIVFVADVPPGAVA